MQFANTKSASPWVRSRKLVAPEPLEQRNAPSTLVPWGDLLASPIVDQGEWLTDFTVALDSEPTVAVARPVSEWTPQAESTGSDSHGLGIVWTEEVLAGVQEPLATTQVVIELPVAALPCDAAVIDAALELTNSPAEVPPPVIQPVIMDPESPFNQPNFGQAVIS